MSAIDMFKEAAKALQSDEVYLKFKAAKDANDADEALQKLIGDFNLARMNLNDEMSKPNRDEEKINELNGKISTLYNDVMNNEGMLNYNATKQGVEEFMNYVNAILNAAIEGDDPLLVEAPAADCGGSCDSCAGCG